MVRMNGEPTGVLKDKWTGETLPCPNCGKVALDKFTGGVNVTKGEVTETPFIYHCRDCDINLTEEEYQELKAKKKK